MAKRLNLIPFEDLAERSDVEHRALAKRMRAGTAHWGRWWYVPDHDTGVLQYRGNEGQNIHEIDLARCNTAIEFLDLVLHMEGTIGVTDEDLGSFVRALRDLLPLSNWMQNPMARHDVTASIRKLLALVS